MKIISDRVQRTLAAPASVAGVGYLTGRQVHLRFLPAPANTGVVFVRTDLGPHARLPATVAEVSGTQRRTTLGKGPLSVGMVEHVLAALNGLRVDNCWVELDASEPPGLDGSARPFVDALRHAGIVPQAARKPIWGVEQTIGVRHNDATLTLHPCPGDVLRVSYLLDYGWRSPISWQVCSTTVTPENFLNELSRSRTFLTEEEALFLKRQGLGAKTKVNDLLVFGPRGPIDNKLHYANEPARHKLLDLIGDLALLGVDVGGHIVAYRSGHSLNIDLVRCLKQRLEACQRRVAA
ncbi:MAG: UDP-3-O-acyl-N-acetylglucosamine deacetylase [Gemmataceae bacterium]|nr:UDP-3-O-acyl-N-acetylglucosamine deacetylase [Gemmataceae bacterium]